MIEKIKGMLSDYTEMSVDKIKPEMDLINDLDLNSLDLVNLIVTFEDEFGVEISDRAIKDLKTVGDIVECLEKYV